ncbi:MAG: hypothetical protein ACR2M9_03445 [Cyanophyceae cyanobacterium]
MSRKKLGQRLMEMSQRKSAPVVEEVTTVKRYTDSDRFKAPLAESIDEYDSDYSVPAPKRDDFISRMFPNLTAAVGLFGKIKDNVQDKYTKAELKKLDESVLDSVLVDQLSKLENILSMNNLEKNLAPVDSRINKQQVKKDIIAQKDSNAVDARLEAALANPQKVQTNDEALEQLDQVEEQIEAFSDVELTSLIKNERGTGFANIILPSGEELKMMEDMADTYFRFAGVKRTPLQLWVSVHYPDMDETFSDWLAQNFEPNNDAKEDTQ